MNKGNVNIEEKFDDQSNNEKFEWRSRTQHVIFFLTYIIDWGLFSFLFYEHPEVNPKYVPSLVHYLVLNIVLGGPMLFFQTFIGQYTRRGCIFLGEMLPIAYGLGYSMLVISFAKFTFALFYTSKIISYLFSAAFNREQGWMICTKLFYEWFPGCFQKEDIDMCPSKPNSNTTCFEPFTKQFSAFIYKEYRVFFRQNSPNRATYKRKIIHHGFHMLCLLPLLLIFALKGIRAFAVSLRATTILCLGGLLSILVVIISRPGRSLGFYKLLHEINKNSLLDWSTWKATTERTILALKLSEGGHFLFGSFVSEFVPDHQRSFYLSIAFYLAFLFITVFYHLLSGLLMFRLNMEINQLDLEKAEHTVFITYPLVLGIQASSYFFSVIYFLVMFLISFHALVLKVFVIQKNVTVQFDLENYSSYINFAIIISAGILTFGVELSPYYKVIEKLEDEIKFYQVCALALQILVLLMYGFQRISDDVQFYMQSEVKAFRKLCSIAVLVLCIISIYLKFKDSESEDLAIRLSACGVFCLPFAIFFCIQMFLHIKKKNIIGLLRGSDLYGPPDVEKRILRILNNPRLAVSSKGREEICYHICLLKSTALKVAVHEEINLIKTFIADLQANDDITSDIDIISQLKAYEKNLLKELSRK